jgi:hypothetical protein
MRALASCGAVVTRSAILATLVTLVGCGGSQAALRRPLVTDQTPLGTPRAQVVDWHREHGWCADDSPHPAMLVFRPCDRPNRDQMFVMLAFADDSLSAAIVSIFAPPPTAPRRSLPAPFPPPRRKTERDVALDIMDALAVELAARYGPPTQSSWTEKRWERPGESIRLSWVDLGAEMYMVSEAHETPATISRRDGEPPPTPR